MAPPRNGGPRDASFDAPTPTERRRMDREQSEPFRRAFEAGRTQGRAERRSGGTPKRTGGARTRSALRTLEAPVRSQITSGMRILSMTLLIVALYAVLNSAAAFSGALGALGRGLEWLRAPDREFPMRAG